MAAALGIYQSRGEAVWGRRTRMSGTCRTEGSNTTRDGQLARYHRLSQCLSTRPKGRRCLRRWPTAVSTHSVDGQVLRNVQDQQVCVFLQIGTGKTRTVACSNGVQQGEAMRPAMLCLALRPGLKRFREEFEVERIKAFAYMGGISLALTVYVERSWPT